MNNVWDKIPIAQQIIDYESNSPSFKSETECENERNKTQHTTVLFLQAFATGNCD